MAKVVVEQDFGLPVERVYAYLSEHENLGPLFGARVERVRDGDDSRNGTGSVRRLTVAPLPPFEETVTRAVPDELVEYRITRGMPLMRGHRGTMRFSSTPTGSRLHYVIEFGSPVPLLDRLLALTLRRNVRAGLRTVEARA